MQLPLYQVDAFTDRLFHGNPAAVGLFEELAPGGDVTGAVAENNFSETSVFVP